MNFEKIRQIREKIAKNRIKLQAEKDTKEKEVLRLKIGIDEYKVKLERLKK